MHRQWGYVFLMLSTYMIVEYTVTPIHAIAQFVDPNPPIHILVCPVAPTPTAHTLVRPVVPTPTLVRPVAPAYLMLTFPRPIPPSESPPVYLPRPIASQPLYRWKWKNLFEAIVVTSMTTGFILLAKALYLLLSSLPSRLSPFARRDWPSDPTVLAPEQYPLLLLLTQRDLPSDPNLYKSYLSRVFTIKSTDVIDFTGHIDRSQYIAAGGSGEVWEASWTGLDKNRLIGTPKALPKVVVKLVRLPPLRDEAVKRKRYKRMKRELELWSKLHHPHILPLIGIACIEGDANLPAFISPWMENGNVMEFLKQNPSFPSSGFLKDIIKGLHYLHTFNPVIVHGDIKGANVLINLRQEAYLSDFGLSHIVFDNTLWRTTATHANGTLRWMAPELIEGDVITPTIATDIYAFGMTCYEILSRRSPFAVANDAVVISKVIKRQRPKRNKSCHSDELWLIITRCWAQQPEDRPSTEETLQLVLQHDTPSKL